MALLHLLQKSFLLQATGKNTIILLMQLNQKYSSSSNVIDAIDCFTNNLVEQKTLKWHIYKQQLNHNQHFTMSYEFKNTARKFFEDLHNLRDIDLCIDVVNLNQQQIDHLLSQALADEKKKHFDSFITQCIEYRKIPSDDVFLIVLQYLREVGDVASVDKLIELCKLENNSLFKNHAEFGHYRARSLWVQGNSDGAIQLLKTVYSGNCTNAKVIKELREIFRQIIVETVENKSQAVLIGIGKVAEYLCNVYREQHVLAYIWKSCFLSEWVSDQIMAQAFFDKHKELRNIVGSR